MIMISLNYRTFNISKGFSLIEMLLVLGVLSVLLIAAFVIYPQVRLSQQTNIEISNILAIRANMETTLGRIGNYTLISATDLTQVANNARVFPETMNNGNYSTSNITNVWGGSVNITPTTATNAGVAAGWAYVIRSRDIPAEACVQMVARTISSFKTIQINYVSGQAGENINFGNYDLANVTEKCNRRPLTTVNFVD